MIHSVYMNKDISADFPFESHYLEVNGSKMHYIDVGDGDPVLFLHGNPTSSYLWRNIIPHVQNQGRCIAPDLIGMGKSDKPDIDYTYDDHYDYLVKFIEKLGLKNITLVIHDWGSGLGFRYAHEHQDNVKGIAFMEAMYKPMVSSEMPKSLKYSFLMMRSKLFGWLMISVANMFVKKMVPDTIVRKLTKTEFDHYKAPFPTIASRKPVMIWPKEVPIDGKPAHSFNIIQAYSEWLHQTDLPKLFFSANPGAIIQKANADYIVENFKNLTHVNIGDGIHFIQEDNPHLIGSEIAKWHQDLK